MKQLIEFTHNEKSYNTLLQPTDWRYSAAIVGLFKFFTEFGIDYLVLENISDKPKTAISGFDGIVYNQESITEDKYLEFAQSHFRDSMTHLTIENLLKSDEFNQDEIKKINELIKSKTVFKEVFGKTKFDGTNAEFFLNKINENRAKIIKSTFRYGKNMYTNFCNQNLLFTDSNKHCRLNGYNVDEGRKTKYLGYCFNKDSFVTNDIPEFDFIPFAFSNPSMYETYFVNNNYSISTLVETNREISRRLDDINDTDAKNKLLTVLKNSKDFIDYDVEIISKNRDEDFYKTLFVRSQRLKRLQKLKDQKFKFSYKIGENYYFNLDKDIYEKCLNDEVLDDSILFMLKVLCSDENSSQYTSYLIKKMTEINVEWKGQDDMLANDIRIARGAGYHTALKLKEDKAENKISSFQQKIIGALIAHDYDRVTEILLNLSSYAETEFGFIYKFLENPEENKDLVFAFASAFNKNSNDKGDNTNE